ncbi:MAG TPA: peptide ABC transporter substrate-binding protein [Ktedonobacterales bacterium]
MLKKGRLAFATTLLMLLAAVVAACGNPPQTQTPAKPYDYKAPTGDQKGGTVIFSDWEFVDSLNPLFATLVVDAEVDSGLWAGPTTITSDAKYVPDQLTEVPTLDNGGFSKDGLTVVMHLRHDLKWSDGQELTADNFVYAMDTLLDPNTAAASTFGYDQMASYVATDKYTLTVKYKAPFASYLAYLPFALPKHAWSSIANKDLSTTQDINLTPKVTSGPFMLSDFAADQSITLVPNKYYVSTSLHPTVLDKAVFKVFASKDALIAGYQAGETDHAEDFTNADIKKLTGLPGLQVTSNISYEHIDPNLQNPVLQDLNVRKAIEEGIDRCQIIQSVLSADCAQLGVDTVLPAPSPEFDPSIKALPFNKAQAIADLKTAGWDCSAAPSPCKKADGTVFPTLNLATTSGNQQRADVTQIVKQDLAAIGIPINLDGQYYPASVFFTDYSHGGILATGKYDLCLFAYVFGLDTGGDLSEFASSEIPSDASPSGGNYSRINDPQVDQALDAGGKELDPAKRHTIYVDLLKHIVDQVYTIPMYLRPNVTLTSTNVANYFPNPTSAGNEWNLSDWFFIKKSQ